MAGQQGEGFQLIMREFHELADAFPLIPEDSKEFAELVKDIETFGQVQPIVMYQDKILDGRNRMRAIEKINEGRAATDKMAHTEVKFETRYPDADPLAFVWSINVVRRQLTPGQRDMAAQKLEELGWGGVRGKTTDGASPKTRKQIAAKTGANVKGMERAKRVRTQGTDKVVQAVESGAVPLHTADRIARLPEADQEEVMAQPPEKIAEVVGKKEAAAGKTAASPARRNGPGPAAQMKAHMTGHQSGIRDVQIVGKYWAEHKDEITKLDPAELRAFIKDVEDTRRAASQLLTLIEGEVLPEWPLEEKKPALLSTALNKLDKAAVPAPDAPVEGPTGTLGEDAAKTLSRTATRKPAARKAPAKKTPAAKKTDAPVTDKLPEKLAAVAAKKTAAPKAATPRKAAASKPVPVAEFVAPADPEKEDKGSE